tara:strand:+ start:197 stop:1075 length:879 start_codon:yes stop_codon:yes gene_type:complete
MDKNINIFEISNFLFSKWKTLSVVVIIAIVISLSYGFLKPNVYRASIVIAPIENQNTVSRFMPGNLSSFSPFAGINASESEVSKSIMLEATLRSRSFFEDIFENAYFAPRLFAYKAWNSESKELVIDSSIFNTDSEEWLEEPNIEIYHKHFLDDLIFNHNLRTGIITISFDHISPHFAAEFLQHAIGVADTKLRTEKLITTESNIKFLNQQLNLYENVETKEAISLLIQSEIEQKMLAEINENYSFKVIDEIYIPESKTYPSRALILIVGTFLITFIYIIFMTINFIYNHRK